MYCEFQPAPHLARFVECYWRREDREAHPSHSVLPDGCCDILFRTQAGEPDGSLLFVGLMTTARRAPVPARSEIFGIRFRPAMASAFLREHARVLDCMLPLEGVRERQLAEQLAGARAPGQKVALADAYLGKTACEPPPVLAALATHRAVDRVTELTGASPRHLRRLCNEHAGVSPKFLSRILRFRRAVQRLEGSPQVQWADFAIACGYSDQAHMIREFQEFAGVTPGRFVQSLRDESRLESGHDAGDSPRSLEHFRT
jgi:AraC-like DNA-binding protein